MSERNTEFGQMQEDTADPPERPTITPSRWKRRLVVLAVVLAVLGIFHVPILSGLGGFLTVATPLEKRDAVLLLGDADGEQGFNEVARLYHEGLAQEILCLTGPPNRLAELGILPTAEMLLRREFSQRDVPDEALVMLYSDGQRRWDGYRRLEQWLNEYPDAQVTVVCPQFYSRNIADTSRKVMEQSNADRLHWYSVADRRFNPNNWWRNKMGILIFFDAGMSWVHQSIWGEPEKRPGWDPDDYERELLAQ